MADGWKVTWRTLLRSTAAPAGANGELLVVYQIPTLRLWSAEATDASVETRKRRKFSCTDLIGAAYAGMTYGPVICPGELLVYLTRTDGLHVALEVSHGLRNGITTELFHERVSQH